MQETKITIERIRNHFTYSWWKYALLIVLAAFGWNLVYTTTAYQPPREKRLDVTFVTYSVPDEMTAKLKDQILARYPEIEASTVTSIVYTTDDNYYGSIQLTTYTGAGEGDVYLLPRERFQAFATSGAFVPLDDAIASGAIDLRGIDVSRGTVTDENGVRAIYGIPAEDLYGMMEGYQVDNRDLVICIMAYSPNEERAVDFINWFIGETLAAKPEWLVEQEQKLNVETGDLSDIPSY